jgi:FeS assembly SUF system protein
MTEAGDRGDIALAVSMTPDGGEAHIAWDKRTLTDSVVAALRTVQDPEIPVNIYDLGLIYRIDVRDRGFVEIDMTLTAPGCPVADGIVSWVRKAVVDVEGVSDVTVNLVFDPPWDQSKMSEEAQLELGLL